MDMAALPIFRGAIIVHNTSFHENRQIRSHDKNYLTALTVANFSHKIKICQKWNFM